VTGILKKHTKRLASSDGAVMSGIAVLNDNSRINQSRQQNKQTVVFTSKLISCASFADQPVAQVKALYCEQSKTGARIKFD